MTKTLITLHLEIATTSLSRIGDFMDDLATLMASKKVKPRSTTIYQEAENGTQSDVAVGVVGRARSEASERARQDFEGDEPAADAEPVKRGRGRPRKQRDDGAEAGTGTAEGGRKRGGGSGSAEGSERNVARGTDAGDDEGNGEGEGRSRSSRSAGRDRGGNSGQARISSGDDRGEADANEKQLVSDSDWDDAAPETAKTPRRSKDSKDDGPEHHAKVPDKDLGDGAIDYVWPDHLMPDEVTREILSELLAEHFNATGGKTRDRTYDIMEAATGTRRVSEVSEEDFDNLAAGLLKDTARLKHGIKPSTIK